MYQLVKSFVSVIVRSQYSSATNDFNVVGGCDLWNVNIGIAFNCSYTDLTTRLGRYLGFVIPQSFLSNDGFVVLTFNVRDQACLKPMTTDVASFS